MPNARILAAALLAMTSPLGAVAAEPASSPTLSLSGFGTLGVVHSDDDKADFTSSPFQAVGAGHTRSWSAAVDSLVAAQANLDINQRLSAIVQVMSTQNYDDTFRPHVEWANLKYQFTPDFSVRVGRTALPLFLVTDSINVGYANPWIRPPIELYNLLSITTNDGLDGSYRWQMRSASDTLQAVTGRTNNEFPIPNGGGSETADSRRQLALVDTFQQGFTTFRLSYGQAHLSIPALDPLFDAFRQFGPQGAQIADGYAVHDRLIRILGVSASYEPGDWFAMAEWARINLHSVLGEKTGWYASGGHRFGQLTPYVTYAQAKVNSNTSTAGFNPADVPPAVAATVSGLDSALNQSLASLAAQSTISAGARWDFMPDVALKLQFDHIKLGAESQGWLTNLQPGFRPGSGLDLVSVAINFVF
jgi:hypothetical protein